MDIRLLNRPWSPRPCDLMVWEASSTARVPSAATFTVVGFLSRLVQFSQIAV